MPVAPENVDAHPIPERLAEPLRLIAGRARMLAWLHALLQLTALCAGVWLALTLLLGWRLQIPLWASIPITLTGWGLVLVGGYRILRRVFHRPRGITAAALMVDAAMPESQERISSALELAQEDNAAFRGSPELVAMLTRQAEHHADTMDPGQVISAREVLRWLSTAGLVLLTWLVLLLIFTPNMMLGLQRLVSPWKASAPLPPPLVSVDPGDYVLAQGGQELVKVAVEPPAGMSLDDGKTPISNATIIQHFAAPDGGTSPDVATPMRPTGDRTFDYTFQNVQQSFTYKVVVDGGDKVGRGESPWYTMTVTQRPAVADVEVQYNYPAYTRLNPLTQHSREGTLEAVVGTKALVTIHATEPVKTAQLLIGDEGARSIATVDLKPVQPAAVPSASQPGAREALYTGEVSIDRSTQYRIRLVSTSYNPLEKKDQEIDNPDSQPRTIRARPDLPPTITIFQPAAKDGPQHVRPDDTVPLQFLATDDFGVSKVEALVQVDAQGEQTFGVPIMPGETHLSSAWDLHLTDLLNGHPDAHLITYRLRATDNRDPNPQTGVSATQTLTLDANAQPLAERMDRQAAQDLTSALKQAVGKLQEAQDKLDQVKKNDTKDALSADDHQKVTESQEDLKDAGRLLRQAGDQADQTHLSAMGEQFRSVADDPVKKAAESAVETGLASDQPQARHAAEDGAAAHTQEALDRLQQIAGQLKHTAQDQPLAHSLERLSRDQQALADDLAKNPNDPKLLQRQKDLQGQLDQLIKENPELQKPAADASQSKVDDLIRKLDQIQRQQQAISEQMAATHAADGVPDKEADLAQQQQALNQDINQFAGQHSEALRQATAKAPDASKMNAIPKELQNNQLSDAVRDQRATASALDQTKARLDAAQARADQTAPSLQSAIRQADADQNNAADLQHRTDAVKQELQQAQANGTATRAATLANQHAAQLADQIKAAANQLAQRTPATSPARAAAQEAARDADAARAAANSGKNDQAQQQLTNAANQLTQAAQDQENMVANGGPAGLPPDAAKNAAAQAAALSQRQKDLADKAGKLAIDQQQAAQAKANAATMSDQQRAIAERIADATRDAQTMQQQTQGAAPDLSNRAGQAAQALQHSTDFQRQAAQPPRSAASEAKQTQAADQVDAARRALTGEPPPSTQKLESSGNSTPPANSQPQNPSAANPPQANSGQTNSGPQGAAPTAGASNTPPSAGQPSNQSTAQTNGTNGASSGASSNATSNTSSGCAAGQTAPSSDASTLAAQSVQAARQSQSQAAGGTPGAAQQAANQLAQAAQQLMNGGPTASAAPPGGPNAPSGQPSAAPSQGAPSAPTAGQTGGQPSAQPGAQPGGSQGLAGQPGQTPGDSNLPSGGMAGQPGQAPGAPAALSDGHPGGQPGAQGDQPGIRGASASGQPGANPGPTPGSLSGTSPGGGPGASGQPSGAQGGQPSGAEGGRPGGQTANGQSGSPQGTGGGGIRVTMNGQEFTVPKEVQEVGVAPSDWVKLSPEMQNELLHASQQPGPPGYRDMIKNYYSRIARMTTQSGSPQ